MASHRNMFVPFCLNTRQLKSAALPSTVLSEVCNCILRNICAETQLKITQTLTAVVGERQNTKKKLI